MATAYAHTFDGISGMSAPNVGNLLAANNFRIRSEEVVYPSDEGTIYAQCVTTQSNRELQLYMFQNQVVLYLGGAMTVLGTPVGVFGNTFFSGVLDFYVDVQNSTITLSLDDAPLLENFPVTIGTGRVAGTYFRIGSRGTNATQNSAATAFEAPAGSKFGNTRVEINGVLVRHFQSDGVGDEWEDTVGGLDGFFATETGGFGTGDWTAYASDTTTNITITEPPEPNFVYQRDGSNQKTVSFTVNYTGTPSPLSYRLINAGDGSTIVNWTVFDSSPSGGSSSLSLTRSSGFTEYLVEVRLGTSTNPEDIYRQTGRWSVGAKVWLAGQSLMQGLRDQDSTINNNNCYSFSEALGFHKPSVGRGQEAFSQLLASRLGCIVAACNTSVGGTCLTVEGNSSLYWNDPTGSLWQNSVSALDIFAPDGRVEFASFMQGGSDATNNVPTATYEAALIEFMARVRAKLKDKNNSSNLVVALSSLGRGHHSTDFRRQNIRTALRNVYLSSPFYLSIPVYPIATDDGTHPTDAGDIELGQSIAKLLSGDLPPLAQSFTGSGNTITVNFTQDIVSSPSTFSTDGVYVESNGVAQTVTGFARTGTRTAQITVSNDLTNATNVSVYLCWGRGDISNVGELAYPKSQDNGLYILPAISENNDFSSNIPPVIVNAGPDISSNSGSTVNITGATASNYDTLIWSCISGQSPTISNPTTLTPAIRFNEAGTHVFQLTASSDSGGSATDTFTASVSSIPNQSPTANAGPDQSVAAATQFTLDGTGSQDTDGTIVEWRWTQTAGDTVALNLEDPARPTATSPSKTTAQRLTFELVTVDDEGAESSPGTVNIDVAAFEVSEMLKLLDTRQWTIVNDGSVQAFEGRSNREAFRFKVTPSDGIQISADGYFLFDQPGVQAVEIVSTPTSSISSTDDPYMIRGDVIAARIGDLETDEDGQLVLTFVLYVTDDTNGLVMTAKVIEPYQKATYFRKQS